MVYLYYHHLDIVVKSKASQLNVESDFSDVVAVGHSQLHCVSYIQVENLEKR